MELLNRNDCIEKRIWEAGDILVLNVTEVLKEKYHKPQFQLFECETGSGLDPEKIGERIYGEYLMDRDYSSYKRTNFYGVIKPEKLEELKKQYQFMDRK